MNIITTIEDMQKLATEIREERKTIGFVPTMGNLHKGHASLIKKAKTTSDFVVVSVFVNPTQFGPNEDFETYPRTLDEDAKLVEDLGADVLFHPSAADMYPQDNPIMVHVTQGVDVLCGEKRPGHFDGVATILTKLFHIVSPHHVYFGLKDAQQVAIVQQLIQDFHFQIQLFPCPLIREEDGLAMSSRNSKLSAEERKEALHLNRALKLGESLIEKGEKSTEVIKSSITRYFYKNLNLGELDYVDILRYPELKPVDELSGQVIIACAVKYKQARLIDNRILMIPAAKEVLGYAKTHDEK
ncbi:pantoate--beta-alanine ligase [Terrilactibacillus laevilacticus]|uniref:pantoate--beta-alanine ligase n=1 Tax=Terrilactibacillus laevilacticus TaxID=1380157 RepID=UPI00114795B7|nr:pantoate--beta-alanine ligase [Terrilactibacillus laevilacticus]